MRAAAGTVRRRGALTLPDHSGSAKSGLAAALLSRASPPMVVGSSLGLRAPRRNLALWHRWRAAEICQKPLPGAAATA
ncbi:hypothetical protein Trco_007945 [Trichoderma cornu-damae]|uniref:Uncharacterized protein n=1 Tax=Trichoderma cornu-damae TaxID=654480 RepID=A0A9P8QDK8_9HYPO|nr:hypothetical protein Trco_007945 [Trichoderma cornu-damae]